MRWLFPENVDTSFIREFATELGVAPFVAEILCRRGLRASGDALRFLAPQLKTLSDPFLLPDMGAAVTRILAAIDAGERIVLYGDYDVDGVSSLALLTRVLRGFGAAPECFLPMRVDEGYGLSADGVARCVSTHAPKLLIAVDCGTSSVEEIAARPYVAKQTQHIDPVGLANELREYGAWDAAELADHKQNIYRLLWIACGDIREEHHGK